MDEIKKLNEEEFKEIVDNHTFNSTLMAKDYFVTVILYLLKDVEGIYFKGGTALQKIFLNYSRLSEDADYTVTGDVEKIRKKIIDIVEKSGFFEKVTKDKDVKGFIRLIAHYEGFTNEKGVVFIDLNKRAKLSTKPEKHEMPHFYDGFISKFSVNTLSKEEMVAEKMAATIGRNKPRDHFDLYKIVSAKIPVNLKIVEEKCKSSGDEFSIIKMFNKAKKLRNRWDENMEALIADDVSFEQVMKTLAKYFKLKEEKDKLRNK